MTRLAAAGRGVWSFVVGDDWITALGVVVALGLTALAAEVGPGWFVMAGAVIALLALSIRRAARNSRRSNGRASAGAR